jgi:hypothetical protein
MDEHFLIQSGREIRTVEDWLIYAGPKEGKAQWTHGRSAMESARAWLDTGQPALPDGIRSVLESRDHTADFQPIYAIPELVTRLDEFRGEHRNHDLVVVGVARGGRTLIGIEAKADEPFGTQAVGTYLKTASKKPRSNAPERIRRLALALFGPGALDGEDVAKPYAELRYQLLTALGGTLIEARRRFAEQAILLVHEFTSVSVPGIDYRGTRAAALKRNADAWDAFVAAIADGTTSEPGELTGPFHVPGSELIPADLPFFLGKVTADLGEDPAHRFAAEPPPDPARGAMAAKKLRALGVSGILVKAAELGYITQVTCSMRECFCPEELGGARYFEPYAAQTDWSPTHEHFPRSRRDGGQRTLENTVLAHKLCNRLDYSLAVGRPHAGDLERIRKAREAAPES